MRSTSLLFVIFLLSFSLQAQYNEVGMHLGLSNYIGDLSENKMNPESFKSLIGIHARRNFTKYFSAKVALTKAEITGNDAYAKLQENRDRNLNFRSDVLELAVIGEVNFSPYNIRANQTGVPYFFTGIAFTHFNPQAQMRGTWYDLQPLQTEGKNYSRNTLAIPFGLGMKFNISYKLNFGFEFGARKTFTDYLDDVSTQYLDVVELRQTDPMVAALAYRTPELTGSFNENPVGTDRGNPENKDWYFFGAITVSVNLTDKYGLDFDQKYEIFKEHLKKPEKVKEDKNLNKRKKDTRYKQKKKGVFRKKKQLGPIVKKRSN